MKSHFTRQFGFTIVVVRVVSVVASLSIIAGVAAAQPFIHYTLGMSRPSTHMLEVEMALDRLPDTSQYLDLILPVWRPGRYAVMDFAGGVQDFSAKDGAGNPLRWEKAEKSVWRVERNVNSKVSVRYRVYANEFDLRTRGLNANHAFIDGTAVFMYVEKYRSVPIALTVHPYGNWHVTTGLDGDGNRFSAPTYDHFVDCPLEIGTQRDYRFTVDAVPHVLSIYGEGNWHPDTLMRDISRIVRIQKDFWGDFPYRKFVFLVHCTPNARGGTEHINSTIMGVRPFVFKNREAYRGFLRLVSHEFFHTWNVKQLRPKSLKPYDYTRENYSQELWIAEGTTSYYAPLFLLRAGFLTTDQYLSSIAGAIHADRLKPGNTIQSVVSSSFDAWIKHSRRTEQAYNSETDFYDRGAAVSLLLDLEIRHRSEYRSSLDEVMRTMYRCYPLSGSGYTLENFQSVIAEEAGADMKEFFNDFVYGVKPLPWDSVLGYAGLRLVPIDTVPQPWIGALTSDVGDRTKITRVVAHSPAYNAGLDVEDEIVALNGYRVRSADIAERIAELKSSDSIALTVFRNDQLREFNVTTVPAPVPIYRLMQVATPSPLQTHIFESWLGTTWDGPPVAGQPGQ